VARGVGGITVIGDEPHAPYNRILLSAVLEGTHRPEAITLRPAQWYDDHGVDLRLGTRAVDLDTHRKVVVLADGSEVRYDRLVLATGSIPTLPPIRGLVREDGVLHDRVHAFRHLDDCTRLLAAVEAGARRAVVVGGGLLGIQVARALSIRGVETEIVEGGGHLLRSQVDEAAGTVLRRSLERLGTQVYTGARAVRFTGTESGGGLRLDNGYTLEVDLVVLTAGGRPSTSLARAAGLATGWGIVVDDALATTDPDVFAIGDCVEHDGRTTGFVSPAWEQAAILAARFAGEDATYDGHRTIARLRATDLEVAVLGDPQTAVLEPGAEAVQVSNPITGTHKQLVVRGGSVVAATLVGDLSQIGVLTQYFDRGTILGPHEPGALVMPPRGASSTAPVSLPDDAEVCACAGVIAGRIRACSSLEEVRETTRATTGCGGCSSVVDALLRGPIGSPGAAGTPESPRQAHATRGPQ
jgi:NAD(P)H-nitrite reductase large subunit